jgi:hypothetical protein
MIPGDKIKIIFSDDKETYIQIGVTGAYYLEFDEAPQEVSVSKLSRQGQITYSYYGKSLHHFDTYRYIRMDDIPVRQLRNGSNGKDIREAYDLEDIKYRITKYYFLSFTKDYKAKSNASYKFWIDGREFDITETTDYQLIKPAHIPEIILGDGVCLDISIQRREIEYDVETKDRSVKSAKTAYIK